MRVLLATEGGGKAVCGRIRRVSGTVQVKALEYVGRKHGKFKKCGWSEGSITPARHRLIDSNQRPTLMPGCLASWRGVLEFFEIVAVQPQGNKTGRNDDEPEGEKADGIRGLP